MPISFEYEGAGDDRDRAVHAAGRESVDRPEWTGEAIEFHDANGVRWSVREASPSNVAAHAGQTSLIFESPVAVRRVWNYPEDWRRMTPDQLTALSWRV